MLADRPQNLITGGYPWVVLMEIAQRNFAFAMYRRLLLVASLIFVVSNIIGQRVGVVLSGGGASAMAHIGFLRALEKQNVPIDYICGTSMGALIGGLYASGYTVDQIDSMVRSDEFLQMATGEIDDHLKFYFKSRDQSAEMGSIRYGEGSLVNNAIPANLIDPTLLDWKLMELLSSADAASSDKFDQLMIPFRCTATDVQHKKQIIFKSAPMNAAIRASLTYPFFIPPRKIDGLFLYDGGIIDNFPLNIMYKEFLPDVIIGCNVSGDNPIPQEDDLMSQLQSMILFRVQADTPCKQIVVVEPRIGDIGTFDFANRAAAIDSGYVETMRKMPEIFSFVQNKITLAERESRRREFVLRKSKFIVSNISIEGLDKMQKFYVRRMISGKKLPIEIAELKKPYFRLYEDDKIKSIFPIARYLKNDGTYQLILETKKERDIRIQFGGNYSSRSINTGYLAVEYNLFGKYSSTLFANSYFGRFYGSVMAGIRWDFPGANPFSVQASFAQNRWDFYRSFAAFFEDVKPSFVLMNERFGCVTLSVPAGNQGLIKADLIYTHQYDQYYQTRQFLSVDTADKTNFNAGIARLFWERNTLNRKQFASTGSFLKLSLKYVYGLESNIPGSTSAVRDTSNQWHQWVVGKVNYTNYFFRKSSFHLGLSAEAVASSQGFFKNYLATAIMAPAFQPFPESRTFFLPQFRAFSYGASGLMMVLTLRKNFDLRAEGYGFAALGNIEKSDLTKAEINPVLKPLFLTSLSAIFHSPLGPISISANYYDKKEQNWSFMFNFGYVIFNRSPRD
jgi:NTE family protein